MTPSKIRPCYRHKPIRSDRALACALKLPLNDLIAASAVSRADYRVKEEGTKSDGRQRICFDAKPRLKNIQDRILRRLLGRVDYPGYLFGGLKGRDYSLNAKFHAGARIVINEDIRGFFENVTCEHIHAVWRHVFRFPDHIAARLVRLTTLENFLPQGTKTANHLANLVFWQDEPRLFEELASMGVLYSRLTDDITVSSENELDAHTQSQIIAKIYGMLLRQGLEPNRSKHSVATSGQRMTVNKLVINEKPSLSRKKRSTARALVHQLEKLVDAGEEFLGSQYRTVQGKTEEMRRFHSHEGKKLSQRLGLARIRAMQAGMYRSDL